MAADQLLIELSASEDKQVPFANSRWNFLLDQSSGNYSSGSTTLDTSSLANSADYLDCKSLTLAIPWSVRVSSSAAAALNLAPFVAGLKSWFGQFIHSITVDYNSTTIVQQTPFANLYQHFKLLTTLSMNDVIKDGSMIGLYPDSAMSWTATDALATGGIGVTNNVDYVVNTALTTAAAGQGPVVANDGFFKRQQWIAYDPSAAPRSLVAASANITQILKSYVTTTTSSVLYRGVALIPLHQLAAVFGEMPLIKGAFFRVQLQLNQSNIAFPAGAYVAGNAYPTLPVVSMPYGGGTNPVMLASKAASNGAGAVAAAAGTTVNAELRFGQTSWSDGTANAGPGMSQIRLYYRTVTMDPATEAAYVAEETRTIRYKDIYQYTISNVAANASVNQILWNSVAKPRELLMIPQVATQTWNVTAGVPGGLLTPFDSAPATTAPMAHVSNFQVNLAGQALFQVPIAYGFSEFLQELRRTGVNYGETPSLCSGLIGFEEFMNNYAFIYVNLHGYCLPSNDDLAKSISVQFTSQSAITTDWYCFCAYERSMTVNVLSGQLVAYNTV